MLTQSIETYITMRRTLGFKFKEAGHILRAYARFAETHYDEVIVAKTVIDWAGLGPSSYQRARRLSTVTRFARYLHAEDNRHEIPPSGIFGSQRRPRLVPYIFASEQINRIVTVSARQGVPGELLPQSYSTLFGLLACTGLRISEALNLRYRDVTDDGLVIRETKFHKTRLLPLHVTTDVQLDRYIFLRRKRFPVGEDHLFVGRHGKPMSYCAAAWKFQVILDKIGVQPGANTRRPTLHSLRHTFAVRALETCSCDRARVAKHFVALSTYLGHYRASDTYWYLEATPPLVNDIAKACDALIEGVIR